MPDTVPTDYGPVVRWAATEAERLLAPAATRWNHVQGVVAAAMRSMVVLPPSEQPILLASAYVHDIGWATGVRDTARVAGLSAATLTAALQGRAVSLRTVQKIAVAIARTPAIPEAVDLLQEQS